MAGCATGANGGTMKPRLALGVVLAVLALMLAPDGALRAAPANSSQAQAMPAAAGALLDMRGPEPSYFGKLDQAIAPILNRTVSQVEREALAQFVELSFQGKHDEAEALVPALTDPVAVKLATWYRHRAKGEAGSAQEIEAFLTANPDWSDDRLQANAELAHLSQGGDAAEIVAFFGRRPPQSAAGWVVLAQAHQALGQADKALEIIRRLWTFEPLDPGLEVIILDRFDKALTVKDHSRRAHRLLNADKRAFVEAALRAAKLLSADEQKVIAARAAVVNRAGNAGKLLGGLTDAQKAIPGVLLSRADYARRANREEEAWTALLTAPKDADSLISPDDWWEERRVLTRAALRKNQPRIAYQLASGPRPLSVNQQNEAEMLAGWVALSYLKDAKTAEKHFRSYTKTADGPISRSTSHYWLGRALLAQGNKADARAAFTESAKEWSMFYGQLSIQMLDAKAASLTVPAPPLPNADDVARFQARDVVHAIALAESAKLENVTRVLVTYLRDRIEAPGEFALLAHLAMRLGDTQAAVRIGKRAMSRGVELVDYAFPTHGLPPFTPLRALPERAFLFGISRQESEFNSSIVSSAGARGLMQVMPITARHVARDYKIKADIDRLLSDQPYNVMMGATYIADRMDEFAGSYILTLAGFNAGPGRVRQWLKEFGDPREPGRDPLDWIERIPFTETREYVKKVMGNIQVYRAVFDGPKGTLKAIPDLYRASTKTPARYGL